MQDEPSWVGVGLCVARLPARPQFEPTPRGPRGTGLVTPGRLVTRETESFSTKSRVPRRTVGVPFLPRATSPKTERSQGTAGLTQIPRKRPGNAKRREEPLSALAGNSWAAIARGSSSNSPSEIRTSGKPINRLRSGPPPRATQFRKSGAVTSTAAANGRKFSAPAPGPSGAAECKGLLYISRCVTVYLSGNTRRADGVRVVARSPDVGRPCRNKQAIRGACPPPAGTLVMPKGRAECPGWPGYSGTRRSSCRRPGR